MDAEEREDLAGTTLRLEQAARDGDERFRRLVADLPVGVLILGRRSEVLFVNRAALELLGFSEDEVLGRTSLDVGSLTREDGSPFPAEEHPGPVALATGKPVRGVVIGFYRPAVKDRIWLLVSAHPEIGPGGRPDQVVVTLSEITARRRHAQAPHLVLVVEDDPVNQKVTVTMLENLGYRADVAGNGLDALQACSVTRYDAILMDCEMPDMDGFKATAWIRQREADTKRRTPIIALTASMMPGDREKCLEAGMDDYLAKPVRIQALDGTLRRWMARPGPSPPVQGPVTGDPVASALPSDHPLRVLEAQGRGRVVVEIIDLFLQTTPMRLDALRQVLASGDAESLASVAHSLKGAALQLGSRGMAALCSRIQAEARSGSAAAVGPLLDELEAEFASVREVLASESARLGAP